MQLKLGIKNLRRIKQLQFVTFWGRIEGTKQNYNILISIDYEQGNYFPKLTFFWSYTMNNFSELPQLTEQDKKILSAKNQYLTGEHDKLVYQFESSDQNLENLEPNFETLIRIGNKHRNLKEVH